MGTLKIKASLIPINWHPGLSIYASEPFLRAAGDEYGWLGGIDDSDQLRCILPYTVMKKKGLFSIVRFRSETIVIGKEFDVDVEKSFLNSVAEYFRRSGADMIAPATTNSIFRVYPEGSTAAPYGSYVIDLNLPEETLWSSLHSKHRNSVRSAGRKGVEVRGGLEYLETAYRLVRDSYMRSAQGFIGRLRVDAMLSYDAFRKQVLSFGENVRILVAVHEGAVQGCAVIPFSLHSAYYLYGGSISKPAVGSMNLLQWEAIRLLRELGVRYYDFVGTRINPEKGSKQEGLMMFKQRFGGRLVSGFIWKLSIHPLKFSIYNLAARLLKGGDIVDQERRRRRMSSVEA